MPETIRRAGAQHSDESAADYLVRCKFNVAQTALENRGALKLAKGALEALHADNTREAAIDLGCILKALDTWHDASAAVHQEMRT